MSGRQQVGNRFELISRGGMSGDANAQLAQVLYRAPHLGARRAQLFGNAGAADDKRRVVAQQANDVAEAGVSRPSEERHPSELGLSVRYKNYARADEIVRKRDSRTG